ncbi:IclR family transcriptional regulator [Brevibacterium samyangense]|uniref:Allantoin degradation transcriptional regulator AllR n=1 Tax=Brevibacterium samyangense TaxID=366888 RepID=A0ABN2TEV5_9MICO
MGTNTTSGVQSVDRAFLLLERIAAEGGEMTISHLAEEVPLPLPTIHRLLHTLIATGYVRQLSNKHYSLGPGLIRLGESAGQQLGAWARPHLAGLVEELGETANMAVLDDDRATYVAQVPSAHSMRMFTEVGRRVHTHTSGVGKAILALLSEERVEAIVSSAGMPVATVHSIGTLPALRVELARIRERGYAVDDSEQEIGVRCLAVSVPGMPTPTAISVSGPESRVDDAFRARAVPLLQETARRIGQGR